MNILKKYGLTDRFLNEAALFPELALARIVAQYRGLYKIITERGELHATISGKLHFDTNELAKFPTVGDFVMVCAETSYGNATIHHVLSRKSLFLRTAVSGSGQAQPIAANIDVVFVCMSLNNNFNLSRLERYLSVAWDSGATPVVLLTKADLCDDLPKAIRAVEGVSAFADVIPLSMFDENIEKMLRQYLKSDTTAAFIGSSGVGKSTLINKLIGTEVLTTGEIGKTDKGRHTTTGRVMFPAPFGGVLIDTPGMRELGVESADLSKTFDDIEELADSCKFSNCTHTSEPGCAILQALRDGKLEQRRLNSYLKLKIESGYEGLNSKEIEVKKLERMFKDVGGMKNIRKFAKEKRK